MKDRDARPMRGAWAPGGYYCTCSLCGVIFTGDKRATNCADCAYSNEPVTTTKEPTFEELLLAYERVLFRHGQWNSNNVEEHRKLVCEQSALKIKLLELHNGQIGTLKATVLTAHAALTRKVEELEGHLGWVMEGITEYYARHLELPAWVRIQRPELAKWWEGRKAQK